MTDRTRRLAALSRAVAKGVVSADAIDELARDIAELSAAVEPGDPAGRLLRDLGTAARQLQTIAARSDGRLAAASFERLPPALRERTTTRLTNASVRLSTRIEGAAKSTPPRASTRRKTDPSFRCAEDFRACMKRSPDRSAAFWCHVAMIVCLARTILPMVPKPGG